jgi:hypothetical protein
MGAGQRSTQITDYNTAKIQQFSFPGLLAANYRKIVLDFNGVDETGATWWFARNFRMAWRGA